MADLGAPTSYLALRPGVPVYDVDGVEVGTVAHVLADDANDIFDGLVIDTGDRRGGWRFADGDQVASLHDRGALLAVAADALRQPEENPAVLGVDPDDTADSPLAARLRRAWEWISGRP